MTGLVSPIVFRILYSPDVSHLKVGPSPSGVRYRAAKARS
jgi:hypothetical protein